MKEPSGTDPWERTDQSPTGDRDVPEQKLNTISRSFLPVSWNAVLCAVLWTKPKPNEQDQDAAV